MIYCFDLDGTICSLSEKNDYNKAVPFKEMIEKINKLYEFNTIKIFTARGASSGIDWSETTKKQLDSWGLKYHELIMNKKPDFDVLIDDKAINVAEWRLKNILTKGVIAGCFDVIHPGYVKMFKEAKENCNHLTICLHENPSLFNKNKLPPILSIEERKEILLSIKYIDEVLVYKTEEDLENLLKNNNFDIRILGDDYKNKNVTGISIVPKTFFASREHGWSTTIFKTKIYENYKMHKRE